MTNPFRKAWLNFEDPITLVLRVRSKLYSLWLSKTYPFVSTGRKLSIHYPCIMRRPFASQIKIGNDVIWTPASLAVFMVLEDGRLEFKRKYDVELGPKQKLLWMGIVAYSR